MGDQQLFYLVYGRVGQLLVESRDDRVSRAPVLDFGQRGVGLRFLGFFFFNGLADFLGPAFHDLFQFLHEFRVA
jgi:hypothetical protein